MQVYTTTLGVITIVDKTKQSIVAVYTNTLLDHTTHTHKERKKMVLLEKLWDDVVAGPHPDHGLGKLRKFNPQPIKTKGEDGNKYQRSLSMPANPIIHSPTGVRRDNVWRSVFNPGNNLNTRAIGAEVYDKPQPNSLTVYDWLYSTESKSQRR